MSEKGDYRDDDGEPMCSICRRKRPYEKVRLSDCPFCIRIKNLLKNEKDV